ncbi:MULTISPECIES: hypothetical protein [unclassified Flavobacterium]|uniref:hypothetical protein n=1 Tax=unclassified Flavobacterium TaxID=196869 RepID=UPI003F9073F5
MKSFIITLLIIGLSVPAYAQVKTKKNAESGMVKMEELPAVVIKRAGADFSVYIPDQNPDQTVRRMEEKFIAYDLGKDYEGYENYLVLMETKNGSLSATYNEKGKLIRVIENYKNVRLPSKVIYSIYKTYPGWTIVNDKYLYTQEEGDIIKKQYNLKIKKDKETRKLIVKANGDIIKVN